MTYSSVIYKLDRRTKKGKNISSTGDISFPQKLPFETLADLMVRGQSICFKDGNVENENSKRIVDMFKRKSTEQPTMAVIISLGYLEDENNLFSANDMGILTIQRGEMGLMTSDVVPGNEKVLWINEVCRSLFDKEKVPRSDGPIPKIMHQAEEYARMQGDKMIFLMVEKQPEHGDGNVLLQYYSTGYKGRGGYGYMIIGEDSEYWFMGKDLSINSIAQAPAMETVMVVEEPVVTPSPRMHESNMDRFEADLEMVPEAGGIKPRKTRRRRHKLRNTNNKSCKSKKMTSCCPHMMPVRGKYMATTKRHNLKYKGKTYIVKTCCPACAMSMQTMARRNPVEFAKKYISRIEKKALIFKNRHTGVVVQRAPLKHSNTIKKRKHKKKHSKSRKHKKGGFGEKPGVGIKSGVLVRIYTGKEGEVLTNPRTWEPGWVVDVVMNRASIVRKGNEEKTIENIHIKPQGVRARIKNNLFGPKTTIGPEKMFQ